MIPSNIVVHQQSKVLELSYENGQTYGLPFELLRVLSPSAEVQGHGPGQETLQTGKRDVLIANIEPVGHYALKPSFSDGHDSGLYSWEFLYFLCENQEQLWKEHLDKLAAAGLDRDAPMVQAGHSHGHSCGSH
uniref:Gamma-butyrobetaine hydroxylase-like N-terminal domain-containing protein n=1 Tax=Polynucleobacter necessarius subsp. necessarius (strain STIR1) TaxID=452638 RepID=B1XS43_POLNS